MENTENLNTTNVEAAGKKEKKKSEHRVRHIIFSIIGILICIILIPMLVINITLIVKSYTNPDSVPDIGGYLPMFVMTDSMYPEIEAGDLVICHTLDAEDVQDGDVIAFFDPASTSGAVVTHRVVDIIEQDDGLYFQTKGDNNNVEDQELVPAENLVGQLLYVIPGAGNVAMFMQTTQGLIVCIIVPLVILILYDVIRRRIYERNKKDDTEELLAELEELKKQQAAGQQPQQPQDYTNTPPEDSGSAPNAPNSPPSSPAEASEASEGSNDSGAEN